MRAERVARGAMSMNPTSAGALTPDPLPAIGRGGGLIMKVFARMFALREQKNGACIARVLQNQEGGPELHLEAAPVVGSATWCSGSKREQPIAGP